MLVHPNACGHFDVERIRKYLTEHNTINKKHTHTHIMYFLIFHKNTLTSFNGKLPKRSLRKRM